MTARKLYDAITHISDVILTDLKDSQYVIPFRMKYVQNGVSKNWDLIKTHCSVAVLIFNVSRNVLVCVEQFRPGVYINSIPENERKSPIDTNKYPPALGLSLELCAGIVDKEKSLEEIAKEEIYQECGYDVPISNLQKVQTFRSAVGVSGDIMTLFYAEVTDEMKTGDGGGLEEEGELIEIVELELNEARSYLIKEKVTSPPEFLYGLMWFFNKKYK